MSVQIQDFASQSESYDAIARDLQKLRFDAGDIPYAEIVRRIALHREQDGVAPSASRPARTTVYDAFRLGRSRVNPQLVGEIARALEASEPEVAQWEERCLRARRQRDDEQQPVEPPVPNATEGEATRGPKRKSWWKTLLLVVACLGINIGGFSLVPVLGLPLFLDMVGTAIAALVLGPWHGVFVGLMTNVIGLAITDSTSLAFGLVNIVGALIWGYGVRRFRLGESFSRFFLLNTIVAVACTIVATTLLVLLFHGSTGHGAERTTETIMEMGRPPVLAIFLSNLLYSLADKVITGFISLAALGGLGRWFDFPFFRFVLDGRAGDPHRPDDAPDAPEASPAGQVR